MSNKYIDELFRDVMEDVRLSSAMIEVVPMAEGSNVDDFLFETNPVSSDVIPILPMTGNVLFPGTITPINVTRTMSLKLLRYAAEKGEYIGVVTQRNEMNDVPERGDLYDIGCIAQVVKVIDMPNNEVVGIMRGCSCFQLGDIVSNKPFLRGVRLPAVNADSAQDLTKEERESARILCKKYSSYLRSVNHVAEDSMVVLYRVPFVLTSQGASMVYEGMSNDTNNVIASVLTSEGAVKAFGPSQMQSKQVFIEA